MALFKAGQSDNPKGKKPGTINKTTRLRQTIEKDLPDIIQAVTEQAKAGDMAACKLLMKRVLPALRPIDQAVQLPLAGADLATDGRVILTAAGADELIPDTPTKLLQG